MQERVKFHKDEEENSPHQIPNLLDAKNIQGFDYWNSR
jgi:hypothetical protein